jgi:hypothetical protein
MSDFITTIGCNQEMIQLTKTFSSDQNEETIAEATFKLCHFVLTKNELNLLNTHESSIRNFQPTTTSSIEMLKQIQSFVPPDIKNQVKAYLTLLHLCSQNLLNINDYDRSIMVNIIQYHFS